MEFDIHEAKTHFAQILRWVQDGAEVVIAQAGEPIARIVPIRRCAVQVPGTEKGVVWMAKDFDAPLTDAERGPFD
jgi:prevent-host-death family protein